MVNLFYLDSDPKKCAQYYCDRHVNKIMVEIAQMLSQAHYDFGNEIPPYKKSKLIKPQILIYTWITESRGNYIFAGKLALELLEEYKYRYNKETHACIYPLAWLTSHIPLRLPDKGQTKFKLTNNVFAYEDYFSEIEASRFVYVDYKCKKDRWTKRPKPEWYDRYLEESNKNRKLLAKKILLNTKIKLPKLYPSYTNEDFLRIGYDNLFYGRWEAKMAEHKKMFPNDKELIYQLGYGHLLKLFDYAEAMFDAERFNQLNNKSLSYRPRFSKNKK
jgi:hypothetical protein